MQICETFPMHIMSSIPLPALRRLTLDPANKDDEFELDFLGCYKWHQIVQEYTSKNLTRGQDKLIALSGVAQRLRRSRCLRMSSIGLGCGVPICHVAFFGRH
jgi:hypothetical protein